jgi:hypothetical protein
MGLITFKGMDLYYMQRDWKKWKKGARAR